MKVYILTDMEGVGGVLRWEQVHPGSGDYEKAREWLTEEVNAAVRGAVGAGASEIVILDGHGANNSSNILYENLDSHARCIQGGPWTGYLQGLDDSFDAMLQIGAHAMQGTPAAVLHHTMSPDRWIDMRINGAPHGEIGLCAAVAGEHGVPFVMVSGDDKACAEAAGIVPEVECAVVKHGISRQCATLLPPVICRKAIFDKVKLALGKAASVRPYRIDPPVEICIDYATEEIAAGVHEGEGIERTGPLTVSFTGSDTITATKRAIGMKL